MTTHALQQIDNSPTTAKDELIQLVSFELGGEEYGVEEYGVEVLKVREIIRMMTITKMPNTPNYVEGIINLRGKVIPIVSMRSRFGLADDDVSNKTRIMVIDVPGGLTGFIVDGVSEVTRIHSNEIQPPPAMMSGNLDQEFITGVFNHAERLLIIMDVDRMFSQAE